MNLTSHHELVWDQTARPEPHRSTSAPASASNNNLPELTRRQVEVLSMLAAGMNDKQIAFELGISGTTVKCHARWAVRRLGAKNRVHAVVRYILGGRDYLHV